MAEGEVARYLAGEVAILNECGPEDLRNKEDWKVLTEQSRVAG